MAGEKKRGRPPKSDEEKKKTVSISLRIPASLRERIEKDAKSTGTTVNKEMTSRLVRSNPELGDIDPYVFGDPLTHNVMRLVGMMVRNLYRLEGDDLWNNSAVHGDLVDAVTTVLCALGPDGVLPEPKNDERPGARRGRSWVIQFVRSARHDVEKVKRSQDHEVETPRKFSTDEYAIEVIDDCLAYLSDRLKMRVEKYERS